MRKKRSFLLAALTGFLFVMLLLPTASRSAQDTLVIAAGTEVANLDPRLGAGVVNIQVKHHIHDTLVWMENGVAKPRLATKWEVGADGKTWTFRLRRGVKFHDGTAFDAYAVKSYLDASLSPGAPPSLFRSHGAMVKGVEVVDRYTVKISSKVPFGQFLWIVSAHFMGIPSPNAMKKWSGQYSTHATGTGPYRLKEWVRGDRLVLERNEDWWGPKPRIRSIIYRPMREAGSRLVALETGQADIVLDVPPHEEERLKANPRLEVVRVRTPRVVGYSMNVKKSPTDDLRVRQAINYAVDKRTIIQKFLLGGGEPVVAPIGPELSGFVNVREYKYDPDKARRLIKEAGAEGASVKIRAIKGRYVMGAEVAQAVSEMLKKVGLKPDLEIAGDWPAYLSTMKKREYHLALLGWAPSTFVTDGALTPLYVCGQKLFNWGDYCNKEVDALVLEAQGTIDPSKQAGLYSEALKILMNDAPWLYLYYEDVRMGFKKGIKGYYITPDTGLYLWGAYVE